MLLHKYLIFETNQNINMKRLFLSIVCALCITPSFAQREILYNINIGDFFDSDANGQGDIKGIREKLNDLQFLDVTTIVLSPVYESDGTNAAVGDLDKINTQYGNFKEYRDLIQEVHNRKMKLYQTVNLQNVGAKHLWFKDSFKNTKSAYSNYIYYADNKNENPAFKTQTKQDVAVNLKNAKVAAYYNKALQYWADPDGNGVFYDGVDGFIFKDVQDKTDAIDKKGNLLKEFWEPLSVMLKKINPAIQIITDAAETTSFRQSLYTSADGVAAYKLQQAIRTLDKAKINIAADSTFNALPPGKYPVVQLENEQTVRLASLPKSDAGKLRVFAGLNILIGGMPVIYYGQEIGVKETSAKNVIDGEALKAMQKDKNSLWNYYKELLKIKITPALAVGAYRDIHNSNNEVISFLRIYADPKTEGNETVLVMINLSAENKFVILDRDKDLKISRLKLISGTPNIVFPKGGSSIEMTPYSVQVWKVLP